MSPSDLELLFNIGMLIHLNNEETTIAKLIHYSLKFWTYCRIVLMGIKAGKIGLMNSEKRVDGVSNSVEEAAHAVWLHSFQQEERTYMKVTSRRLMDLDHYTKALNLRWLY
jgi:hypothetical protein